MVTITFTSQCNKKWNILLKVYSSTFRKPSLFLLLTFFAAFFHCFLPATCYSCCCCCVRLFSGLSKPKMMNYISYFIYIMCGRCVRVYSKHIVKFHTFNVNAEWYLRFQINSNNNPSYFCVSLIFRHHFQSVLRVHSFHSQLHNTFSIRLAGWLSHTRSIKYGDCQSALDANRSRSRSLTLIYFH